MRSPTTEDANGSSNSGVDVELADRQPVSTSHSDGSHSDGSHSDGSHKDGKGDHHDGGGDQNGGDDVKRTSNMWIAAAYNITAIIGVGVLGLPYAMVFLTWRGGPVVLVLAFFITYFTMMQLIELHEFEFANKGKRYGTYHKLGQRAFEDGKGQQGAQLPALMQKKKSRKGLWIVLPLQMIVEVSLDILFTVAAGEAMNRIHDNPDNQCSPFHIFGWFAVFAAIQIVLSFVIPNFESLTWIAIIAAIMSICYSTIAWITVVSLRDSDIDIQSGIQYTPPKFTILDDHYSGHSKPVALSDTDKVFRAFSAIGVVAFAYAAHNVVLEIQNAIPAIPRKSLSIPGKSPSIPGKITSIPEMMRGVWISYAVVAICYFPMGIAVYKIHGNQISPNVLSFIQYHISRAPRNLVKALNMMLIIHLIGSYQIFAMPVFKLLEKWGLKSLFKESSPLIKRNVQYIIRLLYIVFTTILAMIFPYFSPLLGFFGGFAIAPTTFFLPCIIWLRLKNPDKWTIDWCLNWALIILGVILMIVASIGGLYVLIKESLTNDYIIWTLHWRNSPRYAFQSCNCTHNPSC